MYLRSFLWIVALLLLQSCGTGSRLLSSKKDIPNTLKEFDDKIAELQMIIYESTVEPKRRFLSHRELAGNWGALADMYLGRHERFHKRDLNYALQSVNSAISLMLSVPKEVNKGNLFDFLVCRSSVHTKLSMAPEALSDIDRALLLADSISDDFTKRSLRSIALLQKGYALLTVGNDAMTAMHLFNESLHLNPCANLDGEIHAKFILAVRENDYFDADEWRTLAAHVADDFGALGVSTCFNFLQSDPQSSEQPVRIEQVRGIVGSVNIHWMLFSIYEAADDRNQAWAHLQYAHDLDLSRMGKAYDSNLEESARQAKDIMRIYHRGFWDNQPQGSKSRLPIYIVGFFRSGSSILEKMLSQHRSIGTLGETSALVSRLAEMKAEVSRLSASLSESAKESAETEILKNTTQMYLQDIKRYYSEDGGKKLVARIIDKMLWNYRNLGIINSMLPNSYIVHIVRDPMDTLLSCYKNRFMGPATAWSLAEDALVREYSQYLSIMQHYREILPPGRIIELSYESLIAEPRAAMSYIVNRLGLEWDEDVLKESSRKSTLSYTASLLQVKKPLYRNSIGAWRKYAQQLKSILKETDRYRLVFESMYREQQKENAVNSCVPRSSRRSEYYCLTCSFAEDDRVYYHSFLYSPEGFCFNGEAPILTKDGRKSIDLNWLLDLNFSYNL